MWRPTLSVTQPNRPPPTKMPTSTAAAIIPLSAVVTSNDVLMVAQVNPMIAMA